MTLKVRKKLGFGAVALVGGALAASSFAAPAMAAPSPNDVTINLVGFNDFHGRLLEETNGTAVSINGAEALSATILQAQQLHGEANSLVLSQGDAVGASPFTSSILNDEPVLDVFNKLGVDTYTLGNHEFDQGLADAEQRIQSRTSGVDLAANVTRKSDGSHPFGEYAQFDVNGIKVAVIGAVTAETPALVSPDGVQDIDFGDPVAAVSAVADRLSDGNAANGEADIIVASYHEGAGSSTPPATLAENIAASATFARIANETSANVDAIFNAHTHRSYAYDAPVGATTRPIVQAGEYSKNVGQAVLTVDPATKQVTSSAAAVIPSLTIATIPADIAADQRIADIRSIVADAKARAAVLGDEVIGQQAGDITRAKIIDPITNAVTTADDRGNESSIGGIVAQSMLDAVRDMQQPVDAAIMNPGGLRSDLIDGDGKITFAEAGAILPFTNNLAVASITGADLKMVLEEQWQLDDKGAVPSRAYLQLGLSDNFTYTYDSTKPRGERILSAYIDGEPLDAATVYRIAMPTFLSAGGDNFRSLKNKVGVVDTGLIDLAAFATWIETRSADGPIAPDAKRNGFEVKGLPTAGALVCGTETTFTVGKVDLGSLGAIKNRTVTAFIGNAGESVQVATGEFGATGEATAKLTLPEGFPAGATTLTIRADQSGAEVYLPITVECAAPVHTEPVHTTPIKPVPSHDGSQGGGSHDGSKPDAQHGEQLATTGADSNALFGGIAAAIAVIVLGGAAVLMRRKLGERA